MNPHKSPHIYISAGEASGDLLGSGLATALLRKNPLLKLTGMGGVQMANAGVDIKFDATRLSVVGVVEIIAHLPAILSTLRQIKKYLTTQKPDVIVFIDFPDTHLRICKIAKKLNIPVLFYVSPQIWAWRSSRIKTLKATVAHMAVLFSFEEKIYREANIPVTFVGHHLKNNVKSSMPRELAYHYLNLNPQYPIITLLPGSRSGEMKRHLPLLIKTTYLIKKQFKEAQFVIPIATNLEFKHFETQLPNHIRPIKHHFYDLLQITDAAIAASGTVTLEVALMQVPLCIIYKLNGFTYWIAKKLVNVKQIGLCNIVAEKALVKEFIQNDAKPEIIAAEIVKILSDVTYRENMKSDLCTIKTALGTGQASEKVADIALNLL